MKRILVVLVVIAMAAFAVGCEDENGTSTNNTSVSATPGTVLSASPTEEPKATPTEVPSVTPTEIPEITPTQIPDPTPTETPVITPTEEPVLTPTETPTETPTVTPTETPEPTPTEIPEPTPTEIPEPTPTEIPEPTPTEIPELTPSVSPEVTPSAEPTPGGDVTPTVTPTGSEDPTPTVTPTPVNSLPQVAAMQGPAYVIGEHVWTHYMMENAPEDKGCHIDFLYITEPGYGKLADNLSDVNGKAFSDFLSFKNEAVKAANDEGTDISEWFYRGNCRVSRADSVVFSVSRSVVSMMGGAHESSYRSGYNFDTKTGNKLSLYQMVNDFGSLYTLVVKQLENDPKYKDAFLFRDWKKTVMDTFQTEKINWIATDEGLEIWWNEGELAGIAVGEVLVEVRIEDYPSLFAPKYVGGYDGSVTRKVLNSAEYHTDQYNEVMTKLIAGIEKMTWKEVTSLLREKKIAFDGLDDDEAQQYETNAYVEFRDLAIGQSYYLYFWSYNNGEKQRLMSISFRDCGTNVYIDDAYGLTDIRYVMCDPWLAKSFDTVIDVHFANADELGLIYSVTLPYYFRKVYEN